MTDDGQAANGPRQECTILYVEDDDASAYLFQHALEHVDTNVHLFRVSDGERALAFLRREGIYLDAPEPNLVILDINLPKMTGFEVLTVIQNTESLKNLSVVMLTSSTRPGDRDRALSLGARECFIKSSDWEEFLTTTRSISDLVNAGRTGKHRAADLKANHIDYCLQNLGIRVWETTCRLIAKTESAWHLVGPTRDLPINFPADINALAAASDTLLLTAWVYAQEHPGTDIREVLSQRKSFGTALSEHR